MPKEVLKEPIPIDMVFTYADGNDSAYVQQRRRYLSEVFMEGPCQKASDSGDREVRFRNVGEITFSVNSVLKYLPWIRTIFIVTEASHPPIARHFLNSGKIRIIAPEEFIPPKYLPTFSSNVIESFLHRIDGLSEIFLYNNDDYMHFAPCPQDFFFSSQPAANASLELHAYPAFYRYLLRRFPSVFPQYRTNLHTFMISNAYSLLRSYGCRLGISDILVPVHATKLWRRSTARRIDEEFGDILEDSRSRKFRDARDLSYYTILYSMEKKWNPQNRLHLHLFGRLFSPNAMFDFTALSLFGNPHLLWKRILQSHSRLACLNNIPPAERDRFIQVMREKELADFVAEEMLRHTEDDAISQEALR